MPEIKEFPCPNCGSELNYDSESDQLKCLHCHSRFPIEKSTTVIQEKSIDELKKWFLSEEKPLSPIVYRCKKCGQTTTVNDNEVFFECQNCGNNVMNLMAYEQNPVAPSAIIPFSISKSESIALFTNWINKGLWYDSNLKALSITENLTGHYIPFWTFDAQTQNVWSGESGKYYYEQQSYTDANGKRAVRNIQRTSWSFRQGAFEHFFDDVLITGNQNITQDFVSQIYPFHLDELRPLNEKYILGWQAKSYEKSVSACYELAKEYMKNQIYQIAAKAISEDTYRNLKINTNFSAETFKLIILPIWFCTYLFKGKSYSFIINGQTGQIYGVKPFNKIKIGIAIALAVILILLIIYFSNG